MAYPGETEESGSAEGGAYALHCVTCGREIGSKRISDAPDIAAALKANVKLAIRTHASVAHKARTIHRRAIGEDRFCAVENADLRLCIDNGPARLSGRRHEFNAGNFFNSSNEDIAVGSNALVIDEPAGFYLIIQRRKNSRQIAGAEVQNSIGRTGVWTRIVEPAEARSLVRYPPVS